MAFRIAVVCKSCLREIEIDDEYIAGLQTIEVASSFYRPPRATIPHFANVHWRRTLSCRNPGCSAIHNYTADDLRLSGD